MRILLVDDSPMTRRMTRRVLEVAKQTVAEAVDGADGVAKVRASLDSGAPYDLVLCDDQMPCMNGPEAVKAMRALGFAGAVVGVSGNTLPEDVKKFTSAGANFCLPKPLDVQVLFEKVSALS